VNILSIFGLHQSKFAGWNKVLYAGFFQKRIRLSPELLYDRLNTAKVSTSQPNILYALVNILSMYGLHQNIFSVYKISSKPKDST
jgi:hypothetical protein